MSWLRLFGRRSSKERFPELLGMVYCKTQNGREDASFVLASRMRGIEAVVGELLSLDDRLVSGRQLHREKATISVKTRDVHSWVRQLTPNKLLQLTLDPDLPSLPLRSAAVKRS